VTTRTLRRTGVGVSCFVAVSLLAATATGLDRSGLGSDQASSVQLACHQCCPSCVGVPAALVLVEPAVLMPVLPAAPLYPAPVWVSPAPVALSVIAPTPTATPGPQGQTTTPGAPPGPNTAAPRGSLQEPGVVGPAVILPAGPPRPAPPPGTLGRTYFRYSRPVPWDKHPRTAMVEISILKQTKRKLAQKYPDGELRVSVADVRQQFEPLKGYLGTDGLWHFESKPLYPGIPHIYDVKFEVVRVVHKVEVKYGHRVEYDEEQKIADVGVRRIRLIPGRIVTLEF